MVGSREIAKRSMSIKRKKKRHEKIDELFFFSFEGKRETQQ